MKRFKQGGMNEILIELKDDKIEEFISHLRKNNGEKSYFDRIRQKKIGFQYFRTPMRLFQVNIYDIKIIIDSITFLYSEEINKYFQTPDGGRVA